MFAVFTRTSFCICMAVWRSVQLNVNDRVYFEISETKSYSEPFASRACSFS